MEDRQRILILGAGKSGTSLAMAMCREMQKANGCYSTYAMQSGLADLIRAGCREYTNVEQTAEVDHIIDYADGTLAFPHPAVRTVAAIDVFALSSLAHTHARPFVIRAYRPSNTLIYTVRDPRDSIVSWAHYATHPEMLWHYDDPATDPDVLLSGPMAHEQAAEWYYHVSQALLFPGLIWWHYSTMVNNRTDCLAQLRQATGMDFDDDAILEATSFEAMHKAWPEHVRHGTPGAGRDGLPTPLLNYVEHKCRELMEQIGMRW